VGQQAGKKEFADSQVLKKGSRFKKSSCRTTERVRAFLCFYGRWAEPTLRDCASIPAPDGKPYPNLAQHALREAKVLARNISGVLNGRSPKPFVYDTLGMMGSLGHTRAFGQLLGVRVRGILAWFARRTYYLMQMPGWGRRLRIMIDWTFALLYRPDVVKISLDTEATSLLREASAGAVVSKSPEGRVLGTPSDNGLHADPEQVGGTQQAVAGSA
jgi:hypothetical protein